MDIIIGSIIILIALISIIRKIIEAINPNKNEVSNLRPSQNTSQPVSTLDGNDNESDNESDSWDSSDGDSDGGDGD